MRSPVGGAVGTVMKGLPGSSAARTQSGGAARLATASANPTMRRIWCIRNPQPTKTMRTYGVGAAVKTSEPLDARASAVALADAGKPEVQDTPGCRCASCWLPARPCAGAFLSPCCVPHLSCGLSA
ncbi:hypothetical protein Vafri_14957 [Volvox africanus]|uniref:Uncharacterized protein n=1 Tax=Volvox africanus TaxID=51714 RepID=A0A8J4BK57_9CHLO|nr:hypothetical protein Vafri_14957 [Volvox africanus]